MIRFLVKGVVVFDFAWLVDPYTWTGRVSLAIGLPVLTKIFLQSDFYRKNSPFSKQYNQKLRTEIEIKLPDSLPSFNAQQHLQVFPSLSFDGIAHLQKNGFMHFNKEEKIAATTFSSEIPKSFEVTIPATKRTYQIFNTEALGSGAFGDAFIGQDTSSGAWVAVKMQYFRDIAKEQDVLIENKNLLTDRKLLGQTIHEKNGEPYLISILPLFVKDNPMHCNASEKIDFLIAVANELKRLHKKNKIHSDLHFGNVCWSKAEGTAYLIDYGSMVDSENISETSSHYVPKLHLPPESLFGLGLLHVKAGDIFSLGCMAERLFENTNYLRLNAFVSKMKHTLFFKRPSLDDIISELTLIKSFSHEIIEQPIMVSNQKDQQTLDKVYEKIKKYKLILKQLETEIVILKNTIEEEVDHVYLAMRIKEKSIVQNYVQSLISSIELFHRFDIKIKQHSQDELHKDIKQLMALKSDYQPKIPIVMDKPINTVTDDILDHPQNNILLMQFSKTVNPNVNVQQTEGLSNQKKLVNK